MNITSIQAMALEYTITAIGLLLGHKSFSLIKEGMNYFCRFIVALNLFLIVNIPIRIFELKIYSFTPELMFWLYACSVVFMTFVMYYWLLFQLKSMDSQIVNTRLKFHLSCIPAFLSIPLCIINKWTGWLYYIDGDTYHRGSIFVLQGLIGYFYLIINIVWIIKSLFSKKERKIARTALFCLVPALLGIVTQILYGGSYLLAGVTIGASLMYVDICLDKRKTTEIKEMKEMFAQTAETLASAIDAKDEYTHGHSIRVAQYSRKIAELSGLSEDECEKVYFSALLHDVGKIGIPDWIINKQDRLTEEEFNVVKQHPLKGREILAHIRKLPYLTMGAKYHHEHYDGKGYPDGLKATDIPQLARIIAVADSYDAMTSSRSYRKPLPQNVVRKEIEKGIGVQFDPEYAKIMIQLIDQDKNYKMKQNENSNELYCMEYRKNFYEGIYISPFEKKIHMRSEKLEDEDENLPTIILFDAVDGRVHIEDQEKKFYSYCDYCDVCIDGRYKCNQARKVEVTVKEIMPLVNADTTQLDIDITAVKRKDHVLIKMCDGFKEVTVIVALTDSSRFAYIGITGLKCFISDIRVEESKEMYQKPIKRIAEEVKYFTKPDGDIPNIQVDSWCTAFTRGIPIENELKISFYMKSLPSARLIWHCAHIVLFESEDGKVTFDNNIRQFAFIRLDGECWANDPYTKNDLSVTKSSEYKDWRTWKNGNKKGRKIEVTVKRNGNQIFTTTACGGIELYNITTIYNDYKKCYIAFTGDQVIIENIKISGK